ncbi:hypothetical protein [Synechococcus sp. YX-04-1]|jgi:hypothetical protein|nr:hypothetical protein [Synechococcus sp. YX-04-1]
MKEVPQDKTTVPSSAITRSSLRRVQRLTTDISDAGAMPDSPESLAINQSLSMG